MLDHFGALTGCLLLFFVLSSGYWYEVVVVCLCFSRLAWYALSWWGEYVVVICG